MKTILFAFLASFLFANCAEAGKGVYFKIWNETANNFTVNATSWSWKVGDFSNGVAYPAGYQPDTSKYTETGADNDQIKLLFPIGGQTISCTFNWQSTGGPFNPDKGNFSDGGCINETTAQVTKTITNCGSQICVLLTLNSLSTSTKVTTPGKPSAKK